MPASASACWAPMGRARPPPSKSWKDCWNPLPAKLKFLGIAGGRTISEIRELLGISLQETRLAEKLTVRETLELFASFYRRPRAIEEVMTELALTEKSSAWVGKLSGGQKQRLAVATALVANPKILFLDEPTTGLDPQSRRQLWEVIRQFQQHGGTVLLTTHYMDEAERLCDRLAIIDHGLTIASGTPSELIERLGGHHMVEFDATGMVPGELEAWRSLPGVEAVHEEDGRVVLSVREPHETIPALLAATTEAQRTLAAPYHAPSQPGGRLRAPYGAPPA